MVFSNMRNSMLDVQAHLLPRAIVPGVLTLLVVMSLSFVAASVYYFHRHLDQSVVEYLRADTEFASSAEVEPPIFLTQSELNKPPIGGHAASCPSWTDKRQRCVHRYILLFDLWERLVNLRSAFINMAIIGKDVGANVIIPFVHESKVKSAFCTPHHFMYQGMPVQTLGEYFSVSEMMRFGNIVDFGEWALRSGIFSYKSEWRVVSVISAIVVIDWSPDSPLPKESFLWCEDASPKVVDSVDGMQHAAGYHKFKPLSDHIVYERKVCVHGESLRTMNSSYSAEFWERMFRFVQSGVTIQQPITIAMQSYRKYGWQRYVSGLKHKAEFNQIEDLVVFSAKVMHRATLWKQRNVGQGSYVAVHFRAGRMLDRINKVNNPTFLVEWAKLCIRNISTTIALVQASSSFVNRSVSIFLATDLRHDGMRGGEFPATWAMRGALRKVRKLVFAEFENALSLPVSDVQALNSYDPMTAASVLDMAICAEADFFVSMEDSFSRLVSRDRTRRGRSSEIFKCMNPPGFEALLK